MITLDPFAALYYADDREVAPDGVVDLRPAMGHVQDLLAHFDGRLASVDALREVLLDRDPHSDEREALCVHLARRIVAAVVVATTCEADEAEYCGPVELHLPHSVVRSLLVELGAVPVRLPDGASDASWAIVDLDGCPILRRILVGDASGEG